MLESKFVKLFMSVFNCEVNSSSVFALFFILMTHNSPVNLKLVHFQLWTKESHQSPNFETFKCSGTLMGSLHQNNIKFQLKMYRRVILHERILKKKWLVVSNMTWGILWIFTQPLKSSKILLQCAIFVQSIWGLS